MLDHCRARTRRTNYRVGVRFLKYLYKPLREFPSLVAIAGVKRRLAAARLAFIKYDLTPNTTQHLDRAYAYIRAKLVNQTGDKKRNFHKVLQTPN